MLPLHASVTIVPGFLDFTHVQNTGAAFGILNTADFPFKTVVIRRRRDGGARRRRLYPASLAHHQFAARIGLALIIGGAAGNLLDRVVTGSVVDFVDVYWRSYHFWAFNVADSAITDRRGHHDSRHARCGDACIQDCLSSVRSPSTRTASCSPPRTCSG